MGGAQRQSLLKHVAATGVLSVGVVALNFVTGVLVTRSLAPQGRGEASFLLTFAQTVGWLGALGMNEGVTYLAAKQPELSRRIASTAALLTLALGTLGVGVALLLLPVLADSLPPGSTTVARAFVFSIYLQVASALLLAVLAGCQDFGGRNAVQFLQPASYTVLIVALAVADRLTVGTVLASTTVSMAVATGYAAWRLRRTVGFARPSSAVVREAAAYGLRVQGSLIGSLGTTRLATVIMPTVLTFSAIGLYSVATNVSNILVSVVGVMGNLVLPAAARLGGREGALFVARMVRTATVAGVVVATPLFVLAPWLLGLVYGREFEAAAAPLRILLPGVVLAIASGVLESGLQAANRPLAASACQVLGLAVTGVGLFLTLHPFGLTGAAATTTVASVATFLLAVWCIRSEPSFRLTEAFSPLGFARDVREVSGRVRRSIAARRKSRYRGAHVATRR